MSIIKFVCSKAYLLIFVFLVNGFFISNAQIDLAGFEKTESGLYYKFHRKVENGRKAQSGDMITLSVIHKDDNDSVLYTSADYPYPYTVSMMRSKGNADFYEALEMMSEGDSASFIFDSETYYKNTFGTDQLPAYIKKGSKMSFIIGFIDIKTRSEMAYEQMKIMNEQMKAEDEAIKSYLKRNNIKTEPLSSGLYYIEVNKGEGARANEGSLVKIDYSAKLLKSGKLIESTYKDGSAKEISLKPRYVMPGLIEGVSKMKAGGKAILIIPSHLGYGASGSQNVPPNSALLYEIELLKVYD
jgi:FKBP-type peptidyl-prolyl cis-trans isomerase